MTMVGTYLCTRMLAFCALLLAGSCLIISLAQADEDQPFYCKGTLGKSSLKEYEQYCPWVVKYEEINFQPMNRLDLVETCTCNLVDKSLVWDSMLTHEVEAMYYAVRDTVLNESTEDSAKIGKKSMLIDRDHADQRALVWDKFNGIQSEHPPKRDGIGLSRKFEEHLSRVYYDVATLRRPYLNDADSDEMRVMILDNCRFIFENFETFKNYFENLAKVAKNPRFTFRIVKNYPTLYKLMMVNKICDYLSDAEEFIEE